VDFDNVRLTAAAVPEPAHVAAFFALAAGGFALVIRRRRRRCSPCKR
jgi:hypothetical protein